MRRSFVCMETIAPSVAAGRPRISTAQAARIARDAWGLEGEMRPLPGERDRNFLLETPGGARRVLKLSNASERRDVLELEAAAVGRLAAAVPAYRFPVALPDADGRTILEIAADDGRIHFMRLLEAVPGRPLARVRPHSPALLREVGHLLGAVDRE
ncbi:MAG: hypothetical protein ACRELC_04955, partial [Gemmatimonadota bacterium]